jgi:hypothetical protein
MSYEYLMEQNYPWVKLTKNEYCTLKSIKTLIKLKKNRNGKVKNPLTGEFFSQEFLNIINSLPDDSIDALNFLKKVKA